MADSNWDSSSPAAPKPGMPLWGKILIGCGVAVLLALGSCVAGVAYLSHKAKQDPEGVKRWAMGFAMDFIRPEWDEFRGTIEQLRTEEGCKALYKAQPALAKQWSTLDEFLKEAAEWRDQLPELPAEPPADLLEKNELSLNNQFGGETRIVFHKKGGVRVELVWDRARKKGDSKPRRLLHLEVS